VWDTNELFDLASDPQERHNLIALPEHGARVDSMRVRLFERLGATDGMSIPLKPAGPWQAAERKRN
jgi:N-acetylglucosamine-6-sulfatase